MVPSGIIKTVKIFIEAVKKNGIAVDKTIIYGSYVHGVANEFSDIDVAVISDDFGKNRFDETIKLRKIALGVDKRIEPVAVSKKSFLKDDWIPLFDEIKKHGLEIEIAA